MPSLSKAIEAMRTACNVWSLGYDQGNRWDIRDGGECDCSSLVIWCLRQGGFDTGDASYTGNMSSELCAHGWVRYSNNGSPRPGDVLLNDSHHTALYLGDGLLGQASHGDAGHGVSGGISGDQGGETVVKSYYNYPWSCYLRYAGSVDDGGSSDGGSSASGTIAVDGIWGSGTTYKLQKTLGTIADGTISNQPSVNKRIIRCAGTGWLWVSSDTAVKYHGSLLITRMQEIMGITADGLAGIDFAHAIEKRYGFEPDSGLDFPSNTVKAMQRSLNEGRF